MEAMTILVRVTAAVIAHYGRILISRRLPDDRYPGLWELPGGKIESGETPEQCLRRELREELEMEVAIGEPLGSNIFCDDRTAIELMVYRARWNGGHFRPTACQAIRWVHPQRLGDYQFTPADRPFVYRLVSGEIVID
jgi:8-oxo-dGTP diphosphatase